MANLTKTQTQFVDGPNDNSLTLFLDQNNVLNVKDYQQNYNPITCYTGGGGGGGGGLIDVGEGCCSSIRINVDNQAFGLYGSALSGLNNITCNDFTANTWGRNNCAVGCYSSVSGTSNIVVARQSHILSGTNNTIACDATQGAWNNQSAYSGNYYDVNDMPYNGGMAIACVQVNGCDLTGVWKAGDTFSGTYAYSYGVTGTGSNCYTQIQMVNVPIICSEYVAPWTRLHFCYDPTSPSFVGTFRQDWCNSGCSYSFGYLQKTGSFSSYSTYGASYHPNIIAGGAFNVINGYTSAATISGGYQNTVSGGYGTISGGYYNYVCNGGFIGGGRGLKAFNGSTIGGGGQNHACSGRGFIGGGQNNLICSQFGGMVGGLQNSILAGSDYGFIGGGRLNCISTSCVGTISNGYQSVIINSNYSVIAGGRNNGICDSGNSGILGGINNFIVNLPWAFIVGDTICANRACALHVNNLSIMNIPTSSAGLPTKAVWLDATTCTLKMVP